MLEVPGLWKEFCGVRPVRQRHRNDCAIAAVSMATGVPYHRCLRLAREKAGWSPSRKSGICYNWLMVRLGFGIKYHQGIAYAPLGPSRTPVNQRRAVVSVRSINERGKHHYHAVAIINGRAIDPSTRRRVSAERIRRGVRHMSIPKRREP